MTGRLIGVVGASGVGKDTVMGALAAAWPEVHLARRVITRPRDLDGEDFQAVSEASFGRLVAKDAFCLHWRAHGLAYGIPRNVAERVTDGETILANLSRRVLPQAAALFTGFVTLHLTAKPETLAARLSGRGRETQLDISRRLARAEMSLPKDVCVFDVANDGALEDTVTNVLRLFHPVRS
ncbi:MAG: phosphonate metabolism protein/1,5-bisphosphokinase (PRPP-forming) PhnN [Pseudomonadota bacterium]